MPTSHYCRAVYDVKCRGGGHVQWLPAIRSGMHCLCRIRDQPSFALDAVHLPVGISSASIQIFFQCSRCHSAMTFAVSEMEITFKAHLIFTRWLVNLWQNLCRIQSFKDCLVQCVIQFYTPSHNVNSQRFPLCQIFYKRDRAIFKREFFLIDIQNRKAKESINSFALLCQ